MSEVHRHMYWVVALTGCISASDDGVQPLLVERLTATVPPGGVLFGAYVRTSVEAAVDGLPLDLAWPPQDSSDYALWRLPDDLVTGRHEVAFTDAFGFVQHTPLTIGLPWFVDLGPTTGLDAVHDVVGWESTCAESLTALGFADIDLDGDMDGLVGNLTAPSRLYENQGGDPPQFVERTAWLGEHALVTSVQFADYDNDGDKDVFLGRRGVNRLLENRFIPEGVPRFDDVTASSGLRAYQQRTTGAAWGDLDGDGDLDLYEVNHAWCFPHSSGADHFNADHVYRNDGADGFVDITAQFDDSAGQIRRRFGFAAIWLDADLDNDQDLWVINDHVTMGGRSVLWRNDGDRFVDVTLQSNISPFPDTLGKGTNAMGGAVGDVNGDGLPDVAFSNIGTNALLLSDGPLRWRDATAELDVGRTMHLWGSPSTTWGTHLLDVDNDRDLDLFFVGGALKGQAPHPHALFENVGDGPFVERTFEAGVASPRKGAASAQVDLDGDGALDIVVANWGDGLEVLRNVIAPRLGNHWLVVDCEGDGISVNRDAFGAVVTLTHLDGTVARCWRNPMPSMASTGDPGCHFGLGPDAGVQALEVRWPNGAVQQVAVSEVDRRVRVVHAP